MKKWIVPLFASAFTLAACAPSTSCPAGQQPCGDTCVNVLIDPEHCGSCQMACGQGQECHAAACACPAALTQCGSACANLQNDKNNCGSCGNACPDNCDQKQCVVTCSAGKTSCGGSCADLSSDRQHCGRCDKACAQGEACKAGQCASDLYAACFNQGTVYGLEAATGTPSPRIVLAGGGPQSLAFEGSNQLAVADGIDNRLYHLSLAPFERLPVWDKLGKAVNQVLVDGTLAFTINSLDNNVQVVDLSRDPSLMRTVDTFNTGASSNPYYGAIVNHNLYVSLLGDLQSPAGQTAGNKVVEITPTGASKGIARTVDMPSGANLHPDAGKSPFARPAGIAASTDLKSLYVALANLDGYSPGGPGLLAVVDLTAFTVKTVYNLGATCLNPGAVRVHAGKIFVSCIGTYDLYWNPVGGAIASLNEDGTALKINSLDCPANTTGCTNGSPGSLTIAGAALYVADLGNGRLFTASLDDGTIVHGPTNPLNLCLASTNANGKVQFSMISDVLAVP